MENNKYNGTISELKADVEGLKVTLIGIDGRNGMRSQITSIESEISGLKDVLNCYMKQITVIQSDESKHKLMFASKKELADTEKQVIEQINKVVKEMEEDREDREKDREDRKKHLENLKTSRWMLIASIIGIAFNAVVQIIH